MIPILVDLWRRREVADRQGRPGRGHPRARLPDDLSPRLGGHPQDDRPRSCIFLDASDETLVKRFSESRRPHPLARQVRSSTASASSGSRLAPIKKMADEVIDTSATTISQLKEQSRPALRQGGAGPGSRSSMVSFGYKYGVPVDADLIFDTRFLPNPFYVDGPPGEERQDRGRPGVRPRLRRDAGLPGRARSGSSRFLMPRFVGRGQEPARHRHRLHRRPAPLGRRRRAVRDILRGLKYDIKILHRDMYK